MNRLALFLLFADAVFGETPFGAEVRKEGAAPDSCADIHKFFGCAETLFTGSPFHFAVGSIAPGNGVGIGVAVVGHWTTDNWRNSWNADAVASPNGSWRSGLYVTLVRSSQPDIVVDNSPSATPDNSAADAVQRERLVIHLYSQTTSLDTVGFFGIGPSSSRADAAPYRFREIITGTNTVIPLNFTRRLNAAILGEANSRLVDVRSVAGLGDQPGFAQFGEGVRLRPEIGNFRLNYLVNLQQYVAPSATSNSFQRFTVDLGNEFALYKTTRNFRPLDHNGPDSCAADPEDTDHKCPEIKYPTAASRNREGTIGLRLLMQESFVPAGHAVPFYFQPTLGGSDINGNVALASYQDYRFRAPNTILLRGSFEHSIWGPVGLMLLVDEGKVALRPGDLGFNHLLHSYSAGLTLRAGGFPMVQLLYSWGGHEGTHTSGTINTSLLGGTPRPPL